MLRMELACICVIILIAVMFFRGNAKKEKKPVRKIYALVLIASLLNLSFDALTVYTVNHLDTIPMIRNDIYHRIFAGSILWVLYLFGRYIAATMEEEVSVLESSNFHKKVAYISLLSMVLGEALIFCLPIRYVIAEGGNYSAGEYTLPVYILGPAYLVILFTMYFMNRKQIHKKKRFAVTLPLVTETCGFVMAALFPDTLLTGLAITLMALSLYLMLENPDLELLDEAKKEKIRADEANEAKSAFLANMSHEIRTPMNAIVGMTEIMLRTELTPQQKSYLHNIKHSGSSLLLIINDLLDFSKIEAGKMDLVEDSYDPASLFNDVSMIILNRIGDKPIELLYDIDKNLPKKLYGDAGRIKQIIINIMNNAVKFTDEGYITLKVAMGDMVDDEATIYFSVEDSGQGIKEEDLDKLFNAFEQVDKKRNRNKEGSGLGLSICKQLVGLMGGEIKVESEYGKGSKFSFYIKAKVLKPEPLAKIDEEIYNVEKPVVGGIACAYETIGLKKLVEDYGFEYHEVASENLDTTEANHILVDEDMFEEHRAEIEKLCKRGAEIAILSNPMKNVYSEADIRIINKPIWSLTFCKFMNHESMFMEEVDVDNQIFFTAEKAKILIVDDNDMNLKVASGLLEPLKMQIDLARSGKEAIDLAKKNQYHVIFMDHMMPGMDGVETVEVLRTLEEFDGYYKSGHIVALTANANDEAKQVFKTVCVDDLVVKPIDMKCFLRVLKKYLPKEIVEKTDKKTHAKPLKKAALLPDIKGLDVPEGIKNTGSYELFESLLGDFYRLIDIKSSKIKSFYEENMLHDFTIEVHALKNTARMIGALELSSMFKEMEDLGNAEKSEEIGEKLPALLEKYISYKEILLPYSKKDNGEKEEVPKEKLVKCLEDIVDAMDNFDIDRADSDVELLENYRLPEEAGTLMDNLRAYMADVAMDEIVQTAKALIDLINSD